MSGRFATANPHRIKAAHRRRRKVASGQSVQRYYDPGIGRFDSVDPVTAYDDPEGQFHRYRYANSNPYKFTDPDGRQSYEDLNFSGQVADDLLREGKITQQEHLEMWNSGAIAGGKGTLIGIGVAEGGLAFAAGGRWLLTTKSGREALFLALSILSRNGDDLQKVGKRVQREAVAIMKEAKKRATDERRQEVKIEPPKPPKPRRPDPPKPPKPPKPPEAL